jgi:hypothetical protein
MGIAQKSILLMFDYFGGFDDICHERLKIQGGFHDKVIQ